jgi:hypothetical protein
MATKKCGSQACPEKGELLCVICRYIGYCSKGCQTQDWKLRHKRECSHLCELTKLQCGDECERVQSLMNFYQGDVSYSDRWPVVAADLISLLEKTTILAPDKS